MAATRPARPAKGTQTKAVGNAPRVLTNAQWAGLQRAAQQFTTILGQINPQAQKQTQPAKTGGSKTKTMGAGAPV